MYIHVLYMAIRLWKAIFNQQTIDNLDNFTTIICDAGTLRSTTSVQTYLSRPSRTVPAAPITIPHFRIAHGSAKLPEPMLALAKLKKVPTTLRNGKILNLL